MRLYCFPHAGGTGTLFRAWDEPLGPEIDVDVVTYHTRGPAGDEHLSSVGSSVGFGDGHSIQDMAAGCADAMEPLPPDAAFFGHSMGALVAYETVQTLLARGRPGPITLYVSGHVAPHLPTPGPDLHALPDEEFWNEVRSLGGTPPELDSQEIRSAVEPRLRAEFRAAETYRYPARRPLDCDVVAFAGETDPRAPVAGVDAWRMHTAGHFDLTVFPGGHFFIDSSRADILRRIRTNLPVLR